MVSESSNRDLQLVEEFIARLKSWRHSKNQVRGYSLDLNGFVEYLHSRSQSVEAATSGDLTTFLNSLSQNDLNGIDRKASALRQFYSFLVNEANVLSVDPAFEMQVPHNGASSSSVRGPGFGDLFSRGDMVRFSYVDNGTPCSFEGILNGFKRDEGIRKAEFLELADGMPLGTKLIDLFTVTEVEAAGPPEKIMTMDGREKLVLQYSTLDTAVKPQSAPEKKQSFVDLDNLGDLGSIAATEAGPKKGIRSLAASWDGNFDMMAGVVEFEEGQSEGAITISLPDGKGNCTGQYFLGNRLSGTWAMIGPKGIAANGEFKISRSGGSGSGRDTSANTIRFSLGEIRYNS